MYRVGFAVVLKWKTPTLLYYMEENANAVDKVNLYLTGVLGNGTLMGLLMPKFRYLEGSNSLDAGNKLEMGFKTCLTCDSKVFLYNGPA